jgi:aspartyl-tRNA(Asn)/glutamyl-tRNA(Gln) amidotransferase subunit C
VPEEITREIFDHLVHLAALEMDEDEAEYLRSELNSQLKAVHELEEIELDPEVPITSHGVLYKDTIRAPLRDDTIKPSDESEAILAQAPEVEDRYILVPDIPTEALE